MTYVIHTSAQRINVDEPVREKYRFESEAELKAFLDGINAGVGAIDVDFEYSTVDAS